jgi:hypothetical protein
MNKKGKTSIKIDTITDEEAEITYEALKEFWKYNKTDINCPRCRGKFIYTKVGNSSGIECENECGVGETSRGI